MKLKVEIKKLETGDMAVWYSQGAWEWNKFFFEEGNGSCDCNRAEMFFSAIQLSDPEIECSEGLYKVRCINAGTGEVLYSELPLPEYSFSLDGECYYGYYESREAAAKEAFAESDYEVCYTAENCVPPRRVDAAHLLEQVIESTTEEAGEWAENYFYPPPTKEEMAELEASLQKVWDSWEKKHKLEPKWFNVHNTKEHLRE